MSRLMKTIYVDNRDDAVKVNRALMRIHASAEFAVASLDWDEDWEECKEDMCEFCGKENCRAHIGL